VFIALARDDQMTLPLRQTDRSLRQADRCLAPNRLCVAARTASGRNG